MLVEWGWRCRVENAIRCNGAADRPNFKLGLAGEIGVSRYRPGKRFFGFAGFGWLWRGGRLGGVLCIYISCGISS